MFVRVLTCACCNSGFASLSSSPLADLWAPEVLQSVTPTTVRGVLAMLQDYIQLSEGKKAHGHTHNDNMLTSILPSSSHHQGGRVRSVQIGAYRPSSQNNTYSFSSSLSANGSLQDLSVSTQKANACGSQTHWNYGR